MIEPQAGTTASRSHFRRWYLRPWFLLLLAILLPLGVWSWRLGMRSRTYCLIHPYIWTNGFECPVFLEPVEKHLKFLPKCLYQDLRWIQLRLPDEPEHEQFIVDQLRWFPELHSLRIAARSQTPLDLSHGINARTVALRVRGLPYPTSVQVIGIPVTQQLFIDLQSSAHLRALWLSDFPLSAAAAQEMSKLRSLTEITIHECGLTADVVSALKMPATLTSLTIFNEFPIDDALERALRNSTVRELTLVGKWVTSETNTILSCLPLTSLVIEK